MQCAEVAAHGHTLSQPDPCHAQHGQVLGAGAACAGHWCASNSTMVTSAHVLEHSHDGHVQPYTFCDMDCTGQMPMPPSRTQTSKLPFRARLKRRGPVHRPQHAVKQVPRPRAQQARMDTARPSRRPCWTSMGSKQRGLPGHPKEGAAQLAQALESGKHAVGESICSFGPHQASAHCIRAWHPGPGDRSCRAQVARELAGNAEPTADKLGDAVTSAAQQVAEQAQPTADKAEKVLKDNAHIAATEGPARAEEVGPPPAPPFCQCPCTLLVRPGTCRRHSPWCWQDQAGVQGHVAATEDPA